MDRTPLDELCAWLGVDQAATQQSDPQAISGPQSPNPPQTTPEDSEPLGGLREATWGDLGPNDPWGQNRPVDPSPSWQVLKATCPYCAGWHEADECDKKPSEEGDRKFIPLVTQGNLTKAANLDDFLYWQQLYLAGKVDYGTYQNALKRYKMQTGQIPPAPNPLPQEQTYGPVPRLDVQAAWTDDDSGHSNSTATNPRANSVSNPWTDSVGKLLVPLPPQTSRAYKYTNTLWQPGEHGRGIIDLDNQLHTWPEDWSTHEGYEQYKGIKSQLDLLIRPDGQVRPRLVNRTDNYTDTFTPSQLQAIQSQDNRLTPLQWDEQLQRYSPLTINPGQYTQGSLTNKPSVIGNERSPKNEQIGDRENTEQFSLESAHRYSTGEGYPPLSVYHGTTNLALDQARKIGEFSPWHPRNTAQFVADHYGLNSEELYNHPYYQFSRGRENDPHLYLHTNPRTAQSYADIRSEQLDDALSTAHRMMNPESYNLSVRDPRIDQERGAFKNEFYQAKNLQPQVVQFAIPHENLPPNVQRQREMGYEPGTVMQPGPIPYEWLKNSGEISRESAIVWSTEGNPPLGSHNRVSFPEDSPLCKNCGGTGHTEQKTVIGDSEYYGRCPGCLGRGTLGGPVDWNTTYPAPHDPRELLQHPDLWMDNEPGSLTLPQHWSALNSDLLMAAWDAYQKDGDQVQQVMQAVPGTSPELARNALQAAMDMWFRGEGEGGQFVGPHWQEAIEDFGDQWEQKRLGPEMNTMDAIKRQTLQMPRRQGSDPYEIRPADEGWFSHDSGRFIPRYMNGKDTLQTEHGQGEGQVAYFNNEPVASVTWQQTPNGYMLGSAYTHPDHRGQGLFNRLSQPLRDSGQPVDAYHWDNPWLKNKVRDWQRQSKTATTRSLYHGTLIDHLDTIKRQGLQPGIGNFVQDAYGLDEDNNYDQGDEEPYSAEELGIEPAVFMADKQRMDRALTAIRHNVANKLGIDFHDVTPQHVQSHGLLVKQPGEMGWSDDPTSDKHLQYPYVFDDNHTGEPWEEKPEWKDKSRYQEHPYQAEPGDFYADNEAVGPNGLQFIHGPAMMRVFQRQGLVPWQNHLGKTAGETLPQEQRRWRDNETGVSGNTETREAGEHSAEREHNGDIDWSPEDEAADSADNSDQGQQEAQTSQYQADCGQSNTLSLDGDDKIKTSNFWKEAKPHSMGNDIANRSYNNDDSDWSEKSDSVSVHDQEYSRLSAIPQHFEYQDRVKDPRALELLEGRRFKLHPTGQDRDWGGFYRYNFDMEPIGFPQTHEFTDEWGKRKRYGYDPEIATPENDRFGTRFNLGDHPEWKDEMAYRDHVQADPNMIYRGLSHEEWENALRNNYFESNQEYNVGGEQGTLFSTDPEQARSYATGFAPWHRKPGFNTPSYVIGVPRPESAYAHPGMGPDTTEVIVPGQIPFGQVQNAWQFRPYAHQWGDTNFRTENFGETFGAFPNSGFSQNAYRPLDLMNTHVGSVQKEASKLEWLQKRPDLQTPEGQHWLEYLNRNWPGRVGEGNHYIPHKADPLFPWLTREWKKGRINYPLGGNYAIFKEPNRIEPTMNIDSDLARNVDHWADWYHSDHPTRQGLDIGSKEFQIPHMVGRVRQWDQDMALKAEQAQIEEQSNAPVLHAWPDGWTLRRLRPEHLDYEGDAMGHCVGGYGYEDEVRDGNKAILSLRDPSGRPHVTAELEPSDEHLRDLVMGQYPTEINLEKALAEHPLAKALPEDVKQRLRDYHEHAIGKVPGWAETDVPGITSIPNLYNSIRGYPQFQEPTFLPLDNSNIIQIQGKGNEIPKPEYQQRMKDWFQTFPEDKRPNWEDASRSIDHINGITGNQDRLYDPPNEWEDMGGYGPHGDYGLAKPKETSYGHVVTSLLQRKPSDAWGGSIGYDYDYDPDEVKALYEHARERGEIPQLAQAVSRFDQATAEPAFYDYTDRNIEHIPNYPGESWQDDPDFWAHEADRQGYDSPHEAWSDHREMYDEAMKEAERNVPQKAMTSELWNHLNPHWSPYTNQYENNPQQQTFSKAAAYGWDDSELMDHDFDAYMQNAQTMRPWFKGLDGKGLIDNQGQLHTWAVNPVGDPHHDAFAAEKNIWPIAKVNIAPNGTAWVDHEGGYGGDPQELENMLRELAPTRGLKASPNWLSKRQEPHEGALGLLAGGSHEPLETIAGSRSRVNAYVDTPVHHGPLESNGITPLTCETCGEPLRDGSCPLCDWGEPWGDDRTWSTDNPRADSVYDLTKGIRANVLKRAWRKVRHPFTSV